MTFVFADGTVLDGGSKVANTVASPVFQDAPFATGTTQFGDAVQRATFWNAMSPGRPWHSLLGQPRVMPSVVVHVPAGRGFAFDGPTGPLALLDADFFDETFSAMLADADPTTLPIALVHNVFLYVDDPSNCCILGFHGAYGYPAKNGKAFKLQTYVFASWSDQGIFFEDGIADIHALSHEVSEWQNDPFIANFVPPWFEPDEPQYGCSPVLETGDPLVGSAYPVTINGYTYHPQNEALLPWFSRESPSSAYAGAYSFPDTSRFTSPASDCP
jgi:hypothetical protein